MSLNPERLRELLDYCPETGVFTWRVSRGKAKAGGEAGCKDDRGYVVMSIDGKRFYAHRLAALWMTGQEPAGLIDHKDGAKSNNRWLNLRHADHVLNMQNQRSASRNNRLGVLGVRRFAGKYRSQISINGVNQHLGTFDTADAAQAAYLAAKRELHEGCTI